MASKDNIQPFEVASQQSSNYDAGNSAYENSSQYHHVTKVITGATVIEGFLKKMKKYLMSKKGYYKVVGKVMLVASNPKKQFTEKYDLTNYQVQLSQGDNKKFYLYPINEALQLNTLRFISVTPEERARWFTALSQITAENQTKQGFNNNLHRDSVANLGDLENPQKQQTMKSPREEYKGPGQNMEQAMESQLLKGQPVNMSTLTDISAFLGEQNTKLEGQIN